MVAICDRDGALVLLDYQQLASARSRMIYLVIRLIIAIRLAEMVEMVKIQAIAPHFCSLASSMDKDELGKDHMNPQQHQQSNHQF